MNKFVLGTLATVVASGTSLATESEWPELDRELEALSSTFSAQPTGGPMFGGWIISAWDYSSDVVVTDGLGADKDLSGVTMRSARIYAKGEVGHYGYKLEYDFFGNEDTSIFGLAGGAPVADEGTGRVLDAWGEVNVADAFKLRMGRFRQPILQSALIDRNRTLFIDRSLLGALFAGRDEGIMASGDFEQVSWYLAIQNGFDGVGDDYLITGRIKVDILGQGAGLRGEGAYNAGDETNLMVALAFADEGSFDDGRMIAGEAYLTSGPFSLSFEIVDFDDDLGDFTPWAGTGSYLITENYEVAFRWEELDDAADSRVYTAGLNWYHDDWNSKWQLQYAKVDSDDSSIEIDVISLGLAVSF